MFPSVATGKLPKNLGPQVKFIQRRLLCFRVVRKALLTPRSFVDPTLLPHNQPPNNVESTKCTVVRRWCKAFLATVQHIIAFFGWCSLPVATLVSVSPGKRWWTKGGIPGKTFYIQGPNTCCGLFSIHYFVHYYMHNSKTKGHIRMLYLTNNYSSIEDIYFLG